MITIGVLIFIISLPFVLPQKKAMVFNDMELRKEVLEHGMQPVPKNYQELLTVADNADNPMTPTKIALGKKLFFDPILSRDKTISCASCHNLEEGGDDNIPTAIGFHGSENPFHLNSPTVLNASLAKTQFWDGRAKDVEEQAGGPIQAPFEMNMMPTEVRRRLAQIPEYVLSFQEVFHDRNISFENVRNAIGAYERTLLTRGKYDLFLEGDDGAISASAKRGLTLFITKGCKGCHAGMSLGGQSIQKFPLRFYPEDFIRLRFSPSPTIEDSPFPFENIGGFLGKEDALKFRVPILRNISRTAPYFHNGTVKELKEAVRIMSKYQIGKEFDAAQIDDMVTFLKTLEGDIVDYSY
jgi:cytochrome c peroxidase